MMITKLSLFHVCLRLDCKLQTTINWIRTKTFPQPFYSSKIYQLDYNWHSYCTHINVKLSTSALSFIRLDCTIISSLVLFYPKPHMFWPSDIEQQEREGLPSESFQNLRDSCILPDHSLVKSISILLDYFFYFLTLFRVSD